MFHKYNIIEFITYNARVIIYVSIENFIVISMFFSIRKRKFTISFSVMKIIASIK